MGKPRWELKRDLQQELFLGRLLLEAEKRSGDSVNSIRKYCEFHQQLATMLLSSLPKISHLFSMPPNASIYPESSPSSELSDYFVLLFKEVRKFGKTPEEVGYLLWKFLGRVVERAGLEFIEGYERQKVLRPEEVCMRI